MNTTEMRLIRTTAKDLLEKILPLFDDIADKEGGTFVFRVSVSVAIDLIAMSLSTIDVSNRENYLTALFENIEERFEELKAALKTIDAIQKAKNNELP